MSALIVNGKTINGDIKDILNKLKLEAHKPHLFKDMKNSGDYLMITCPFHSNGKEEHPSSGIVQTNTNKMEKGFFHCFACGVSYSFPEFVSRIFNSNIEFANNWLIKNFGGNSLSVINILPPIELKKNEETFIDEKILKNYDYYHPYMWKRKLTKEVVDKYRVGYDPLRKCLTFPVWDVKGRLKMITTRAVDTKKFYIQKEQDKDIYLLNFILKENPPVVMITEGQIDALTAIGYGFPCCATIGSLSFNQIKILNKSGIRSFITAFDNDAAGKKFTQMFNENIRKDILVYNFEFPKGKKDINDLTKEEFWGSLNKLGFKENFNKS